MSVVRKKKAVVDKTFRQAPKDLKLPPDEVLITTHDKEGRPFQYVAKGWAKE